MEDVVIGVSVVIHEEQKTWNLIPMTIVDVNIQPHTWISEEEIVSNWISSLIVKEVKMDVENFMKIKINIIKNYVI